MTTTQEPLPSKRPRSVLAGPYGHPFHPILVTVPIGAWVASFVFDLLSKVLDNEVTFVEGSFWLLVIGIVTAFVAAIFGTMDLMTIPSRTKAASTALAHMALNTVVVVIFSIGALIRHTQGRESVSALALGISILGLLVLGASGWLGGKLSYTYGVRVANESTQTEGYK